MLIRNEKGFTLIELLIVIAVIGVLVAALLLAINPLEQLARGRDAGRLSAVNQLGRSIQAYYTSQANTYPAVGTTWATALQTAGEIKVIPVNPAGGTTYVTGCGSSATLAQNGYCYNNNAVDAIVYTRAESGSSRTKGGCVSPNEVWIVWSSADGKTGLTCTANTTTDPAIGVTGLK